MRHIKTSVFFEWLFSDRNDEGVKITYTETLNKFLFDRISELFYRCEVLPNRLTIEFTTENDEYTDLKVGTEVILIKD